MADASASAALGAAAKPPRADAEKIAVMERLKRCAWRGAAALHAEVRALSAEHFALLDEDDHTRLAREAASAGRGFMDHG